LGRLSQSFVDDDWGIGKLKPYHLHETKTKTLNHHRHSLIACLLFLLFTSSGCNRDALQGIYPADGDEVPCGSTTFSWSMEDPTAVEFVLEEEESKEVVRDEAVQDQTYTPSLLLKPNTAYTWRLKAGSRRYRTDFKTLSTLASLGNQVEGQVCRTVVDSNTGSQTTCESGFLSLSLGSSSVTVGLVGATLSTNTTFSVNDPASRSFSAGGGDPHNNAHMTIGENYRDVDVTVQSGTLGNATTYTFTNH
jgi:hypothetical protein